MSNPSQSNQHPSNKDTKNSIEELTDDLDFWNIDTSPTNTDSDSDALAELERILVAQDSIEPNDQSESSHQEINEILTLATAKINAEREMKDSLSFLNESKSSKEKIKKIYSPLEKYAAFFCYLALVGILTYLIIYASQQHNFDSSKPYATNTPVEGNYASIESIVTSWSDSIENKTRLGVILVPSATITLDSNSKSGVIRSVFYSYEEGLLGELKPKGDSLTHEFVDGKFNETGTNQITLHCTDGFEKLAHYAFYRDQDEKRWTIEVKEAPSIETNIESFKPLAHAPIEPIRN